MYLYESKKKRSIWGTLGIVVLSVGATVLVMQFLPSFVTGDNQMEAQRLSTTVERNSAESNDSLPTTADIVEDNMKSVVGISVLQPDENSLLDINVAQKWGIGTGIIISENGYILTNQHIATSNNAKITVTLEDGSEVQGKTIWTEKNLDLALIKIESKNLVPASLGDSDTLRIGEDVIAIGNPLGLEFQRTVTRGIVSGLNRSITFEENGNKIFMEDLIQTDASINSGNSGGPLINGDGEVIGINTVKITSAEGIGFALPINVVKPILEKLEATGKFEEGYLGIYAHDKEVIPYIKSNVKLEKGIYVVSVDSSGPSGKAGVKVGDIITQIDNVVVNKMIELREYIYTKAPGDRVTLTVMRNNREETIVVTLGRKT
ncbi:MAG: trypsin-like peptidase domain-containing protein [Clostridia bacterium]|nr:trypsin-like peptidase domain-containing protein [Clostridia bacterium]